MIYILEFLRILLELFVKHKDKKDEQQTNEKYRTAADNPRDFFDDGLLNNSDSKHTNTNPVPSTKSTGQPE